MLKTPDTFKPKMKIYGKQLNMLLNFGNITLNKEYVKSAEYSIKGELLTSVMRQLTLEIENNTSLNTEKILNVEQTNESTVRTINNLQVKYLSENPDKIYTVDETNNINLSTMQSINIRYLIDQSKKESIKTAKTINVKLGVRTSENDDYVYVDWGEFVVYSQEDVVDTNSTKIYLYDHLIDTHINYDDDPLNLDFENAEITISDYLQAICDKFGFTLLTTEFADSEKVLASDIYSGLGYTYRDILDEIAETSGGFIKIFNKDLSVAYPAETGEVIDEEDLEKLTLGELVGAFNTVILGRSPQEDNIYYPEGLSDDERVSIRIDNNQIMDSNREDFIENIYNKINGLEYYIFESTSFGFGYFEFGDIVTLKNLNNEEFKTIMFNIVINIDSGIKEKEYSEETEYTETKYEYASSIEKRVTNTEIITNKQENKISLIIEQQADTTEKINSIEMDIDSTKLEIQNLEDDTNTKISTLTQTAESLESEITNVKTTLEDDYSTTSEMNSVIEQTVSSITDTISSVETKVETAQTTADNAQASANTAQSTANTAITNAETAQATAEEAQASANEAQTTANTAVTQIETTTEKLTEVSETVDGITETINSIETKVETVEKTVDTATENIQAVQEIANNAQSAADNAQETADNAVEQITTTTTKLTEVEETVDGITQSVSSIEETVNNLEVGSRNLLLATATQDTSKGNYKNSVSATGIAFLGCEVFQTNSAWADIGFKLKRVIEDNELQVGDVLTYSIYTKTVNILTVAGVNKTTVQNVNEMTLNTLMGNEEIEFTSKNITCYTSPSTSGTSSRSLATFTDVDNTEWKRLIVTFAIDETMMNYLSSSDLPTRFEYTTASPAGVFQYWAAPQLEKGTLATYYAPAPEDMEETIEITKTELNTTIEQTATSITDSVSEQLTLYATLENLSEMEDKIINEEVIGLLKSYVTATDLENNLSGYTTSDELDTALEAYVTSAEMSTTVEQTQESIISEVNTTLEGYVTTINLDNTLSSYSTTLQMNSAISQTQTSILNTVSSTYTTITDTETLSKTIEASLELKLNTTDLISEINASADVITLTSNRLSITSDYFTLTETGEITATSGTVGGFTLGKTQFSNEFSGTYDYNLYDVVITAITVNSGTVYNGFSDICDVDSSGEYDVSDISDSYSIAVGTSESTKVIEGSLTINADNPKNNILIQSSGENVVSLGVGGINTIGIITDLFVCGNAVTPTGGGENMYFKGTIIDNIDNKISVYEDGRYGAVSKTEILTTGITITNIDQLGIGTTTSTKILATGITTQKLELSFSTPYIDFHFANSEDDYTARIIEGSSGALTVYYSITTASDKRLKNNVEDINSKYMELFDKLEVKTYNFNNSNDIDCGFIAQDVLELEESLGIEKSVLVRNTGEEREINGKTQIDYYSLNYNNLTAMCVKKIQELEKRIEELEGK